MEIFLVFSAHFLFIWWWQLFDLDFHIDNISTTTKKIIVTIIFFIGSNIESIDILYLMMMMMKVEKQTVFFWLKDNHNHWNGFVYYYHHHQTTGSSTMCQKKICHKRTRRKKIQIYFFSLLTISKMSNVCFVFHFCWYYYCILSRLLHFYSQFWSLCDSIAYLWSINVDHFFSFTS